MVRLWMGKGVARRQLFSGTFVEFLESRRLLANTLTVTVPEGGNIVFTNAVDKTLANLQFQGAAGTVTFAGTGLERSSALNGEIVVKGNFTFIDEIDVTSATPTGSIIFRSTLNLPLKQFTSTSVLKSVVCKQMTLEGELDAPGIAMVNFGAMQNANLQFTGNSAAVPVSIVAGPVTDTVINSNLPFKSINFGSYTATTPGNLTAPGSSITTAPSIGIFHVAGNSTGDLNLTGGGSGLTLGSGMVLGNVTAGLWHVNGNTGYMGANSFGSNWRGIVAGYDWGLRTTTDFDGNFTVGSVTTASIGRSEVGANIHFTYTTGLNFSKWNVKNAITASYMDGPSSFGSLSAQFMDASYVLAGVGPTFNFGGTNQFTNLNAVFNSISIHCHTSMITYASSVIAAPSFGSIDFGMIQTSNNGTPFGIRDDTLTKALRFSIGKLSYNFKNVSDLGGTGISQQQAGDFYFTKGG